MSAEFFATIYIISMPFTIAIGASIGYILLRIYELEDPNDYVDYIMKGGTVGFLWPFALLLLFLLILIQFIILPILNAIADTIKSYYINSKRNKDV